MTRLADLLNLTVYAGCIYIVNTTFETGIAIKSTSNIPPMRFKYCFNRDMKQPSVPVMQLFKNHNPRPSNLAQSSQNPHQAL